MHFINKKLLIYLFVVSSLFLPGAVCVGGAQSSRPTRPPRPPIATPTPEEPSGGFRDPSRFLDNADRFADFELGQTSQQPVQRVLTEEDIKDLVKQVEKQANHNKAKIGVILENRGTNEVFAKIKFRAKKGDCVNITTSWRIHIKNGRLETELTRFQMKGDCELWCGFDEDLDNPRGKKSFTTCGKTVTVNFDANMSDLESELASMFSGSVQGLQVEGNRLVITYIPN